MPGPSFHARPLEDGALPTWQSDRQPHVMRARSRTMLEASSHARPPEDGALPAWQLMPAPHPRVPGRGWPTPRMAARACTAL
eukprot:689089-Pyramimonas_sp.AAC.1